MQEILNMILDFVKSDEVLNIGLIGSVLYFIFSKAYDKILKTKLTIKLDKKSKELKETIEMNKKQTEDSKKIIKELKEEYLKVKNVLNQSVEIAKKQNEALTIAFNNSNLQPSAKLLVEDILKVKEEPKDAVSQIEMSKDDELPISNAVKEDEEAKEDERKEIKRVK
ncbi:MAG: hypothetical protein [Podoviridae sp. ctcf755]|nr:MAG: hypothetical protein [Podoviridae sp. ctcf755]